MAQTGTVLMAASSLFLTACDYREFESSDRYQSDFHYSYDLKPGGRVEVDNFNGGIEITGWDQPRCEISGSKYGSTVDLRDHIKIDISATPNLIYVRSLRPTGEFHGNVGVRYVIHVPRKVDLSHIVTSNGSIHVEEIDGRADVKTSNGPVRVDALTGGVNVHTSNGAVTVENVAGPMTLRTTNGAVRAEHVSSGIEAYTSNGPITVHFDEKTPVSSTPLKFETNNGRIDITLPTTPRSDIKAHTSNSSIALRLPANAGVRLRAGTTHGKVQSDFKPADSTGEKHRRSETLEQTIGVGGPMVDLHTSNGSIRVYSF